MLELIGIGVAGAVGIYGHLKSRKFVRKRLRYTSVVEKPGLGIFAVSLPGAALAQEVADELDVPLGTVCTKISRGLKAMRKLIKREGFHTRDVIWTRLGLDEQ